MYLLLKIESEHYHLRLGSADTVGVGLEVAVAQIVDVILVEHVA